MLQSMSLSELATICHGVLSHAPSSPSVSMTGVSIDTRTLQSGNVYVALKGERADGHEYCAQAIEAGASVLIVSKQCTLDFPQIVVTDTLGALTTLAHHCRRRFQKPVIGITGSSGKTTVKEMCRAIFGVAGHPLCPPKSFNNHIGVPLTLCQLREDHDYAIIECGTNHPGEIEMLANIIQPTIALVNNIGRAHLEGLGSQAGIAQEKSALYRALPAKPNGLAVLNRDDKFYDYLKSQCEHCDQVTFGLTDAADIQAVDVSIDQQARAQFTLQYQDHKAKVVCPLPGRHQVSNVLAAVTLALSANIAFEDCVQGIHAIEAVPGRWLVHQLTDMITVIDDSYNANPDSVKAAMTCLGDIPGTRIFVLGDMGELGENAQSCHEEVGHYARKMAIDKLFTIGELSKHACASFGDGGKHYVSIDDCVKSIQSHYPEQATIVVKGSRIAGMERVVQQLLSKELNS